MGRIYSSYTEAEFENIQEKSKEYGMTPSAFQKYCVLLHLGYKAEEFKSINLQALKDMMCENLNAKRHDDTFIVSALLPPEIWSTLNRSQKITLSLYLKELIDSQPDKFEVADVLHNNVKQYRCKK